MFEWLTKRLAANGLWRSLQSSGTRSLLAATTVQVISLEALRLLYTHRAARAAAAVGVAAVGGGPAASALLGTLAQL